MEFSLQQLLRGDFRGGALDIRRPIRRPPFVVIEKITKNPVSPYIMNFHYPYDSSYTQTLIDHNLMREGTSSSDTLFATKRLLQEQEDMFLQELLSN